MKLRPSALPIFRESPCFVADGGRDFTEAGQDRHAALKAALNGDLNECELMDEESQAGIRWALDFIRLKAPMGDYPLIIEEKREIILPDFEETKITGTPDVTCGPALFDFKWRRRNYREQLAAYSLALFQAGHERVEVHVLYGAETRAESWTWTREEAENCILDVLEIIAKHRAEKPSEYCGWCGRRVKCPALNQRAQAVAAGREDWALETYHASEIAQPEQMSKALALAKALEKWIEGVEFHAREMMIKQGCQIPGWRIQTRAGQREIKDIEQAHRLSGLPAEQFLGACSVTVGKLEEIYAAHHGLKKAEGKREINGKLAGVIEQRPATEAIVKEKE